MVILVAIIVTRPSRIYRHIKEHDMRTACDTCGFSYNTKRNEHCPLCSSRESTGNCPKCGDEAHVGDCAAGLQLNMVTTLSSVPNFCIVEHLGFVSAITSNVGVLPGATVSKQGNSALSQAMFELMASARQMGANAIVGVQTTAYSANKGSIGGDSVGILVSGSAVIVEELDQIEQ